ncbi:MAG: sensor domain-containing phosphodiesterase, partial [Bosea sp. (in: a-proteobacteria)]
PGLEALVKPGDMRSLDQVYCRHICEGRLPSLIRDTRDIPLAMSMPVTHQVPIGSHLSVPIRRDDGSVFGMFCCLSPRPNASLTARDLEVMELFAAISAREVNAALAERSRTASIAALTEASLRGEGFDIVYQPIFELSPLQLSGFEALCRFTAQPYRTPDLWFAEAARAGLGPVLESAVAVAALSLLETLPEPFYLSVNAGPDTVVSGRLESMLTGRDLRRVILEITEQAMVVDEMALLWALDPLRDRGMRLAVDDAGAGYAGLQQILRLRPDLIKLDMSLTRDINRDHARASLAQALVGFASDTGAILIAEGIETHAEFDRLREIGIARGQGYLLGRPMSGRDAVSLARQSGRIAPPSTMPQRHSATG